MGATLFNCAAANSLMVYLYSQSFHTVPIEPHSLSNILCFEISYQQFQRMSGCNDCDIEDEDRGNGATKMEVVKERESAGGEPDRSTTAENRIQSPARFSEDADLLACHTMRTFDECT